MIILLFAGGLLGLITSSILMMIVLHRLSPYLNSYKQKSLRDSHTTPLPRLGGISIFWGFILTLLIIWFLPFDERGLSLESLPQYRLMGLLLGGLLAWSIGIVDDLFDIHIRWKLLGQGGIAMIAIMLGFEILSINLPFIPKFSLGFLSWPVTILWIGGVMNAVNLIDGIDGLASGISIIALLVLASICWFESQYVLLLVILALIGTTFGFFSFNHPPASIFMGDSGSLFLGYSLAVLSLWVTKAENSIHTAVPLLILAIPLLDTGFAFFRRFLKGIPFYSADKDHIHHRLITKGYSPFFVLLVLTFISLLFGLMAIFAYTNPFYHGYSYLGGAILAYLILYWLEYDIIRNPLSTMFHKKTHQKRRSLMMAIGENIDSFLEKEPDQESVLRSFVYWTDLVEVSQSELSYNGNLVWQKGSEYSSQRMLLFKKESWELRLALPESSWTVDSDVKGNLLEKVSMALLSRLEKIDRLQPQTSSQLTSNI
ncbi:MAG: undecaprenyl/decaprenyl-phosphate alpha-N-acetylglucosaminyl 1-phosphate transferase [Candidatus Marinimicrobia bacterium]|nr:undecaprenyl/decaprenyl-phosphate alpha-N-acetylglucosaminyl 1-phosphate transferase [Candidatus Neomarinimicrobiota bacterium]